MLTALALSTALTLTTARLPAWMTGESHPEDLTVSLVTFGPGDTLTEWWGHTALVVEDRRLRQARLYNFGMFGFSEGFVERFAMGRLEFWVDDSVPPSQTYEFYRYLNRDVRIQELDLLPDQAWGIAKALGTHVLPENRTYLYDHYRDNCSTRPRDLIDVATDGQLKAATVHAPARMTLREHTGRYSSVNAPMSLVLDFLQNDSLDKPLMQEGEAFLPDELERQVQALVVTRPDGSKVPLVRRQWTWFQASRPPLPDTPPHRNGLLVVLGGLVGGAAFALGVRARQRRWARVLLGLLHVVWGLGPGILGLGLFLMGLFTNHMVTHGNENLFFASPLTFALMPLGFMLMAGARRAWTGLYWMWVAQAALSVVGVLVKVLPVFDQQNWNVIALLVPVNLSFAALFWRDRRAQTKAPATQVTGAADVERRATT